MLSKNLHPFYSGLFLHLARECGLSVEQLRPATEVFSGLSASPSDHWYLDLLRLMKSSPKYHGTSPGFDYGHKLDLASAGIIGQAVMTAPTLGEALKLMCRYYPVTGLELYFTHQVRGDEIWVYPVLDYENIDPEMEIFIFEAFISSWRKCSTLLVQRPPLTKRIEMTYSAPSYADKYNQFSQGKVRFNCPVYAAVFDVSAMSLPTLSNNSFVHERARAHCEAALSKLGETQSVYKKVQKQLRMQTSLRDVCVDSVAQSMHISKRTLIRKLQAEGYRFQELLDLHRYKTACRLLTSEGWMLEKIADYLGYSDASNFRRAFKKWSGLTPKEYRCKH